jgi:hypothetical protein
MASFLDLPPEILQLLYGLMEYADIVSVMATCSTLWQLRHDFAFWRNYHLARYGSNFMCPRLGDPYISVRQKVYSRWIMAERIIDILYEPRKNNLNSLSVCYYIATVFGGYLRDRLARRLEFRDINVSLNYNDYENFWRSIHRQLLKYNYDMLLNGLDIDPKDSGIYQIYDRFNPEISVTLRVTFKTLDEIAVDFDINSLFLKDRHTLALRIPTTNSDLDHALRQCHDLGHPDRHLYRQPFCTLEKVIQKCRQKTFGLTHARVNDLDQLKRRFDYMISLGFKFETATMYLP